MSSVNFQIRPVLSQSTYNGAPVRDISPEKRLLRMTLAHMLWEDTFYVDGKTAADELMATARLCKPEYVAEVAKAARSQFKLRHVPLLLMREMARKGALKAADLAETIQRPDEMGEFLAIYRKNKKEPISNQVKKGLAQAFGKFKPYQLAKWDKNSAAYSLRDVMFLTHPKPANAEQADLFKKIADEKLETPDTWETQLSAGADKKETFTRLMLEKKMGALAFVRNLRNMDQAGVDASLIRSYSETVNVERVLPFRFISAARMVPKFESMLEKMMFRCLEGQPKLKGKTVILVDISGSMFGVKVTAKSDLDRFDAAAALAVLCRELCEEVDIFSFSTDIKRVPDRRGFALVDAIRDSQSHGGTMVGASIANAARVVGAMDRMIVVTDEQSSDTVSKPPAKNGYILNVAQYKNGVNHSAWTTITGFSEAVFDYIQALEAL